LYIATRPPTSAAPKRKQLKRTVLQHVSDAISKQEELKSSACKPQDEFHHFAMNVASQPYQLPLSNALQCQSHMQDVVTRERLALLESQPVCVSSVLNTPVTNVSDSQRTLYSPQDFDVDIEGMTQNENDGSILSQAIQSTDDTNYFDMQCHCCLLLHFSYHRHHYMNFISVLHVMPCNTVVFALSFL
jgi:hypothetical protein